jgi:spore germination cell wall hydrolase CwlJ-like protein
MYLLQKFTKTVLSLTIIVAGIFAVDRETFHGDPVAEGIIKVAKAVDPRQLLCMADNIYHEAGGESTLGKAAVARVVMNRVNYGFGKSPCEVINQITTVVDQSSGSERRICQFSWRCNDESKVNRNSERYKQSERVAYQVLAYDEYHTVVSKSTLYFHNTSVDPQWPLKRDVVIGNHVFYSKHKHRKK